MTGQAPIRFVVLGTPAPQGSKIRTEFGMRESSQAVGPWREAVKAAAQLADVGHVSGPVVAQVWFRFQRPKTHYGTGRNAGVLKGAAPLFPTSRNVGDIDKLLRSSFDALTDVGAIDDDSCIVAVHTYKGWAHSDRDMAGQQPGATINITAAQVEPW